MFAQGGEISGKITDDKGEDVIGAIVAIVDATGKPTGKGAQSDYEGNYIIKPLPAGTYNLRISYTGLQTIQLNGIVVGSDKIVTISRKMKEQATELGGVEVIAYKKPLIDSKVTSSVTTITAAELAKKPSKDIADAAGSSGRVYQSDNGKGSNIGGGRLNATAIFIDGVRQNSSASSSGAVSTASVAEVSILAGGVSARYGDVTGGVISITSKGPADRFTAGAEVQTSEGLDGYGWTLGNVNFSGPVVKGKKSKKPILGLFGSFEYQQKKDPNPSALGVWQVNADKLDSLRQFPLQKNPTEQGYNLATQEVTMKDMYITKIKPNTKEFNYRANARIDIKPTDNIALAFGGSINYKKYNDWVDRYTLFNYENNPLRTENNYRVYGRITQNFLAKDSVRGKDGVKRANKSIVQNAYYTAQVDYEHFTKREEDETHGFNAFDYGYIGKFDVKQAPSFADGTALIKVGNEFKNFSGVIQNSFTDTSVTFTPSDLNGYATNYTKNLFDFETGLGRTIPNLAYIEGNKGLLNGYGSNRDVTTIAHNIWYGTGRQYNGFGYDNDDDQYHTRIEASLDLLKPGSSASNKHNLEFGFEFEQRIQRSFRGLQPIFIWTQAALLANNQLTELDLANPIFRIDGKSYTLDEYVLANANQGVTFSDLDTILYDRAYDSSKQSNFDKNLRQRLGMAVDSRDLINIQGLNPDQLDYSLFSADELLNNGNSYVSYRGYDYTGKRLTTQPHFFDFFKQKDAKGNYTRQIAAYRPIYAAAYISDKFFYKDLTLNLGLRIDRFDANQYVLKDPYSLYDIHTVNETGVLNSTYVHPSNIPGNATIYLKNGVASDNERLLRAGNVAGYRVGNTWFDEYGRELSSGASIAAASPTGITPYLKEIDRKGDISLVRDLIKQADFNPEGTFKRYKANYIFMPRMQMSFNITKTALFYAHYDILSQRPQGGRNIMDPTEFLFFTNNVGPTINNANLRPERTIDFEVGFQQAVAAFASIKIGAFYREFRDQIQYRFYKNAYPTNYYSYDNIDLGTVKGFSLDLDIRRIANFSATANYTLQFAEGTGSDDQSQLNLVRNSPEGDNFKVISPLNYDARHTFNILLDYSFGSGIGDDKYNGPIIKNRRILADAGINFQIQGRSGTPYTKQVNLSAEGFLTTPRRVGDGSVNGARLPWNVRVDMRVYKGFSFKVGKKSGDEQRKLNFQVYLQIQNLLNTKNVLSVYRYTGNGSDDGYLLSSTSASVVNGAQNPQSFKDLYNAYTGNINAGTNYTLPRRIYLGLTFNF